LKKKKKTKTFSLFFFFGSARKRFLSCIELKKIKLNQYMLSSFVHHFNRWFPLFYNVAIHARVTEGTWNISWSPIWNKLFNDKIKNQTQANHVCSLPFLHFYKHQRFVIRTILNVVHRIPWKSHRRSGSCADTQAKMVSSCHLNHKSDRVFCLLKKPHEHQTMSPDLLN